MKKSNKEKNYHINERNGNGSQGHWEIHLHCAYGKGNDPAGAFLPRPGKDRAQPHEKVNECDH